MDDGFVDVYAKATGEKHRVPVHWMTHPTLSRPFRKTPKSRAAEESVVSATPATDVISPSETNPTTSTPAAGAKE